MGQLYLFALSPTSGEGLLLNFPSSLSGLGCESRSLVDDKLLTVNYIQTLTEE